MVLLISMNRGPQNETPAKAFKEFLRYKRARNLSEETLEYYQEKLNRFLDRLGINKLSLININKKIISRYIIYLKSEYDIVDTTVNAHLRAVVLLFLEIG